MRDHLHVGPTPAEEECANIAEPRGDVANRAECIAYRHALERFYGEPPNEARFGIKSQLHEFGSYREVVIYYNPDDELEAAYAFNVEAGLGTWAEAGMRAPFTIINGLVVGPIETDPSELVVGEVNHAAL